MSRGARTRWGEALLSCCILGPGLSPAKHVCVCVCVCAHAEDTDKAPEQQEHSHTLA